MRLRDLAGIKLADSADSSTVMVLVDAARAFLLGGGVFDMTDWCDMDNTERACFMRASKEIRIENMTELVSCIHDPHNVLILKKEIDGGLALEQAALERAIDKKVEGLSNEHLAGI